ncbi:hypothetical protein GJV26_10060 [Massilia dura]|uniref:Uncharacterized protein n=2 Tax=Pseudoduganella dura TaxID=321982 RepID=A0A6I3X7J1_9BURK|nr:hypothetical protein [Pseudoduganella dura]MUI12799.1 hypothetical protein [Pseudoduganella dura]
MRYMDFSSWQTVLTTFLGLAVFTLVGVGIRMLLMQTVQQRRERMNRQINERLKTLIAAYRTLGGSFTGELTVDPRHLRDLKTEDPSNVSERSRRIRDAVEAALSDILLLGTEEHCRLAGQAAADMAAGRPIHTADLVISLRDFIREALDLGPIPADVTIPLQGPTRAQSSGARGKGEAGKGSGGGGGGGNADGGGGGSIGSGSGFGLSLGLGHKTDRDAG